MIDPVHDNPPRPSPSTVPDSLPADGETNPRPADAGGVNWAFGVFAGIILLILLGWGFGGNGRGWGHDQIAHMMPPSAESSNGPATRAWTPNPR